MSNPKFQIPNPQQMSKSAPKQHQLARPLFARKARPQIIILRLRVLQPVLGPVHLPTIRSTQRIHNLQFTRSHQPLPPQQHDHRHPQPTPHTPHPRIHPNPKPTHKARKERNTKQTEKQHTVATKLPSPTRSPLLSHHIPPPSPHSCTNRLLHLAISALSYDTHTLAP